MLRRYLWLIIVVIFLFNSCGRNKSEAKELLEIILQVVGIPQETIINICQTTQKSDICKGAGLDSQKSNLKFEKVKRIGDGKFLLETTTPCEPILVVLKDSDILYNDGKFLLKFSGVEIGVTQKELSMLDAMVDALYLQDNLSLIKNLNSKYAQDSFYSTLFIDFKKNLNTLREKGLNLIQSIRGTLKGMADELIESGVYASLPQKLNGCGNNQECIDSELKRLSDKLLIDRSEAEIIFRTQKDNNSPLKVRDVPCQEEPYWITQDKIIKDTIGDRDTTVNKIIPPFIDLSNINLNITDDNIESTISLFKYSPLTSNSESRDYLIQFFIEDRDILEVGVWMDNYDGLYQELYIIKDGKTIFIENNNLERYLNISENKILFTIPKSLNEELLKITPSTKVHFWSRYAIDEKESIRDSYPNIYEMD